MKPFYFLLLAFCLAAPKALTAQDTAFAEERYRVLSEKVNQLIESYDLVLKKQQRLQDKIDSLSAEVSKMKEDFARGNVNLVTSEQLKSVVEQLREVDRKREQDNDRILKSIKELAKLPASPSSENTASSKPSAGETPEGYWSYKVKKGDSFSAILAGYNSDVEAQGYDRITLAQLKAANPQLNRRNYPVEGETLKIPMFPKKKKK